MPCCIRDGCEGCVFCEPREPMTPGLHVAAHECVEHPGSGSRGRLEIAALRAAISYLESTGEAGTSDSVLLLEQRIDEISGPSIPELRSPEDSGPSGAAWLYAMTADGVELKPTTLPFYGKRKR